MLLIDGLVPQRGTFFLADTRSTNFKSLYHSIYISCGLLDMKMHGWIYSSWSFSFLGLMSHDPQEKHTACPPSTETDQFCSFCTMEFLCILPHFMSKLTLTTLSSTSLLSYWLLSPLKSHALKSMKDHSSDAVRKIHQAEHSFCFT